MGISGIAAVEIELVSGLLNVSTCFGNISGTALFSADVDDSGFFHGYISFRFTDNPAADHQGSGLCFLYLLQRGLFKNPGIKTEKEPLTNSNKTKGPFAMRTALLLVKAVRVELTSESISTGISPSAAFDLLFRLRNRPKAGCHAGYPVGPLCYRELTQSFPV